MTKDGGSAFPYAGGTQGVLHYDAGMSLRDWFAGQLLANGKGVGLQTIPDNAVQSPEALAQWAYEVADAMLEAREAKDERSDA